MEEISRVIILDMYREDGSMASNPENINFLDLACLLKIEKDTTLERFGSVINASIFDAANITGSLSPPPPQSRASCVACRAV